MAVAYRERRGLYLKFFVLCLVLLMFCGQLCSGVGGGTVSDTVIFLKIPPRSTDAIGGVQFARQITGLSLRDREIAIVREIISGNVPSFSRTLRALRIRKDIGSKRYELVFFVTCDYLAIGSDDDYLYVPLTPHTAQYLANRLGCLLPTKEIVDTIYSRADIKLRPQPIPPSERMTTVPVFVEHTDSIRQQFISLGVERTSTAIVAGHKKDIIISNRIYSPDRDYERVVIYGWHRDVNDPIQPVYNGHHAYYVDYSHGVRFVAGFGLLDGDTVRISDLLRDPELWQLLSDEGVISRPYYPSGEFPSSCLRGMGDGLPGAGFFRNYPNPFTGCMTVSFLLPGEGFVRLVVYNSIGQVVRVLEGGKKPAGLYYCEFDGRNLPAGPYFIVLYTGERNFVRKVMIVR